MADLKALRQMSQKLSVLYVEDDDMLREKTASVFEQLFARVDTAEDGERGLEQYEEYMIEYNGHYDVIISDIQMPKMDGIELSRRILEQNPMQRIIITSAHNDKEYLIKLINIGVSGFLEKPLSLDQMSDVLHNVIVSMESSKRVMLGEEHYYDGTLKALFCKTERIELSEPEVKLLDLLTSHIQQSFSAVDIFNHLYYDTPEKEYSEDSIKSLIKRIRKKLPPDTIANTAGVGYYLNLPS